jgi:hypothetical protein
MLWVQQQSFHDELNRFLALKQEGFVGIYMQQTRPDQTRPDQTRPDQTRSAHTRAKLDQKRINQKRG